MVALAYAQVSDDSADNLQLVLLSLCIVAATAVAAAVPVWGAWRRRHPHLEIIGAAMVIWGIALAWSSISLLAARMDWQKEKTLRVESGYDSNPTDLSAPAPPVAFWSALFAAWLLVDGWAFFLPIRPTLAEPSHPLPSSVSSARHAATSSDSNGPPPA